MDVVDCVTYRAAKTYHLDMLGEIKIGKSADFTFFDIKEVNLELEDCYYNLQKVSQCIVQEKVMVSGGGESELYQCTEGYSKA